MPERTALYLIAGIQGISGLLDLLFFHRLGWGAGLIALACVSALYAKFYSYQAKEDRRR
jgi:hypothetical protein